MVPPPWNSPHPKAPAPVVSPGVLSARRRRRGTQGLSLIEVCISTGVAGILLSGLFVLCAQFYSFLQSVKQTSYATQVMQSRVESFRTLQWVEVTSKAQLQAAFTPDAMKARTSAQGTTATAGTSTANFNDISERLVVSPYYPPPRVPPSSGVPPAIQLDRNANGTFSSLPSGSQNTGTNLSAAPAVKVQLTVWWAGARGRVRQREITTFLSRNGL